MHALNQALVSVPRLLTGPLRGPIVAPHIFVRHAHRSGCLDSIRLLKVVALCDLPYTSG